MEDFIVITNSSDEVLKWALSPNPTLEELQKIRERENGQMKKEV